MLFKEFDEFKHSPSNTGCKCCDICQKKCKCTKCIDNLSIHYAFLPTFFLFNIYIVTSNYCRVSQGINMLLDPFHQSLICV